MKVSCCCCCCCKFVVVAITGTITFTSIRRLLFIFLCLCPPVSLSPSQFFFEVVLSPRPYSFLSLIVASVSVLFRWSSWSVCLLSLIPPSTSSCNHSVSVSSGLTVAVVAVVSVSLFIFVSIDSSLLSQCTYCL